MINTIRRLRIIALMLFLTPAISLIGSLLINNYLITFKFTHDFNYNFKENIPGNTVRFLCKEENDFCDKQKIEKYKTLGQCNLKIIKGNIINENGDIKKNYTYEKVKSSQEKLFLQFIISDKLNKECIINSSSKTLYNYFPFLLPK